VLEVGDHPQHRGLAAAGRPIKETNSPSAICRLTFDSASTCRRRSRTSAKRRERRQRGAAASILILPWPPCLAHAYRFIGATNGSRPSGRSVTLGLSSFKTSAFATPWANSDKHRSNGALNVCAAEILMARTTIGAKHAPIGFQIAKKRFDFLTWGGGRLILRERRLAMGGSCVSIACTRAP